MDSPQCELGYPVSQLETLLGDRMTELNDWMYGQTAAICEGRKYNYETHEYESTDCGPHGVVYYSWDVQRFLDGRPIID